MPPPMPNPAKRMTANPARPVARYRPGKPVAEQESSDEDEEPEEEQQRPPPQRKPQATRPQPSRPQRPRQEESDDDEEGFVTDEEDGADATAAKSAQQPVKSTTSTAGEAPIKRESTREESEEEESEEEESSEDEEEEESSSEEEEPRRKFQRPTFIKKSDRKPSTQPSNAYSESPDPEVDTQTRRLAQAELLIKDKLERDALARAQGKKAWDDDDELVPESMVDDTDGLDPAAEYAAWKLRELKRLKRDREALIAREKELEEIERRRNLTAEEREKEDKEYLERQKQEREEGRSETAFLSRYHHKGAFFQGDETAELLKRRDVMGARFEDEVTDKSILPEYMRLRDMTKLGKKGRTRYTDLKGQDTGRFGEDVKRWKGSGGGVGRGSGTGTGAFDTRGLDERFLPDDDRGEEPIGTRTETPTETPIGLGTEIGMSEVTETGTETDESDHTRDPDRARGLLDGGSGSTRMSETPGIASPTTN
ncbi:hypothetical protein AYL99_02022 [Fonsecaea erecta]|uniref:Micro-fibrillar-associated protein 1 C-terminal domain-containing protein n=1 Tax=Fonsecaea erecta TaxID=1367422 RepID=A0A178ZUP2_9EURO|nr:hypothetical protein AYL99_02022 [Fonsecaea erecta]OAP62795.1 hypothetical protein AYL99_02022 [Fonsecaea erecta]